MRRKDYEYDAIVIGTGMSGGWALKELTEAGLETLALERGRMVRHKLDYQTEHKDPHEIPGRGRVLPEELEPYGRHMAKVSRVSRFGVEVHIPKFNITGFLPTRIIGEKPVVKGPTLQLRAGNKLFSFTEGNQIRIRIKDVDFLRLQVLFDHHVVVAWWDWMQQQCLLWRKHWPARTMPLSNQRSNLLLDAARP